MNTLYLECKMGAAGDMLAAALLELAPDRDAFLGEMNALGLAGVRVQAVRAEKCGIRGTRVDVTVHGHGEEDAHAHGGHGHAHSHRGLAEILALIDGLPLSREVRGSACEVYRLLAEAEAEAHGCEAGEVHFHEVGMLDAVADIVGVCRLMEILGPCAVAASPVQLGGGQVRCAHGLLPVPAPATAALLRGVPTLGGAEDTELCTPTGAALLKHFVRQFGPQPLMRVRAVGVGCGKKDFRAANCLRAFWGEAHGTAQGESGPNDAVTELCANIDDMTGEALGFAAEALLSGGALDVYTVPMYMKKGRPAHMLCCLCRPADADRLAALVLRHTTSFGVRSAVYQRYALGRSTGEAATPWGPVRVKSGEGYGVQKSKIEYEDAAKAARAHGNLTLAEVLEQIKKTS